MGIATLRMPMLPNEVPPERREMVLMAGRGSYMMATRQTAAAAQAFEGLVARYPETPNVHYAYAVYLLIEQPEKAIEEFKRELQIQPNHPDSLMQIAFEYLKESNAEAAMPWAKQAVAAAPKNFAAHKALGDALLASNDIDGAIAELELSAKLAPDSPSTHLSLAKAYQRAGRSEAAMKEREEFARLDRLMRTNRSGEQSVGGIGAQRPPGARHLLLNDPYFVSSDSDHDSTSSRGTLARRPGHRGGHHQERRPAASGAARHGRRENQRHGRPRRRRRPGQARDARQRSAAVRLRGPRGRRVADDWIVDPDLRGAPPSVAAAPATATVAAPAAPAAPPSEKPASVPITALVFDRLTPDARQVAIKAAKSYLGDKKETANYMGVFGIDLSLKSYTPFTRNVEELRKGIESIENRASTSFGVDKNRLDAVQRQADAAQQSSDSATSGAGGPGGAASVGSSSATAQLASMEARMLTGFDVLERDEAGYSQVNALYAMIGAMRSLPGRKSIVLFSEGVAIPPAVHRLFLGVIDAANRANVSIYTMDAAGLRAESEQAKIRDEVNKAGERNLSIAATT